MAGSSPAENQSSPEYASPAKGAPPLKAVMACVSLMVGVYRLLTSWFMLGGCSSNDIERFEGTCMVRGWGGGIIEAEP